MYRIGLSTPGFVSEQLFSDCRDAGISYIEISLSMDLSDKLDFEKLKEWSEKYGVKLWSFHLPFYPVSIIDISREDISDNSVEYLTEFIKKGSFIGIDKYIIHASGEPIEESDRKKRMMCAKRSLDRLAKAAAEYSSIICVENLPRTCLGRDSSDMAELLSANDSLRACFDTNHLLDEDITEFINALGDKIITTHISDYDFKNERHWLPGEGDIDWQSLINALKNVNYSGIWLYEIGLGSPWTLKRDRDLTCRDFSDNARALFSGSTPAPLGNRVEGLKHWKE